MDNTESRREAILAQVADNTEGVIRIQGTKGDVAINYFFEFPSEYFPHSAFCDMLDQFVAEIKERTK